MKKSFVSISGVVASINMDKRDLTLLSKDSEGNAVKNIIHMWKTDADGDNPAWQGRDEWRNNIEVGSFITINGWMGNNGRIIAGGYYVLEEELRQNNRVELEGVVEVIDVTEDKPNAELVLYTATNAGRDVRVKADVDEELLDGIDVNAEIKAYGCLVDGKFIIDRIYLCENPFEATDETGEAYA